MKRLVLAAAAAAGVMVAAPGAQAFPADPQPRATGTEVIEVRGLCGLGWHRGALGECRPNGTGYGYVYRPYAYAPPPYRPRCWWIETPYGPRRVCAW